MYDSADYANQRLQGTIVMCAGKPSKVIACMEEMTGIVVTASPIKDNQAFQCKLSEVDLTPVKLGFANVSTGVAYLTRIPMRRDWKQGLRQNNMRSVWGADVRWVTDKDLHNTIVGKYPKFDVALEEVVNTEIPRAFSRDFALINADGIKLVYKWDGIVGDVVNNKPNLYDKFNFLAEVLQEAVGE